MKGIKGVSAYRVNQQRRLSGRRPEGVWQPKSFDRIIRYESELLKMLNYILFNSVKLGLTVDPYLYPWYYHCGLSKP